jgi:flagellar protein FliL
MAQENSGGQNEEAKKGSPLKLIIILVVALAGLGGGGFFAYTKFFKAKPPAEQAGEGHGQQAAAKGQAEKLVIYDWEPLMVNLADPGGKRYLKLNMKVELTNEKALEELKNRSFQLKDAMLMLLSGKEFDDISTSSGKQALKQETIAQVNKILKTGQVREIYFTDFIVQ